MGCAQSTAHDESDSVSRSIDRQLQADAQMARKTITIFLCGTGESGKSTILKQMRLRYDDPYTIEERMDYSSIVVANTVQSMAVLVDAMGELEINFSSPQHQAWAEFIQNNATVAEYLDEPTVEALKGLWATPEVKKCLAQSSKFQINDSAIYYFSNMDRIVEKGYMATNDDILRARVRTTGIIETKFKVKDRIYRVLDVGGQRSERRKWVACFEGVDVLLFLFAVSEFDQVLFEDETTNRFVEAEALFSSISNSLWFKRSTIVAFLNKVDLLAEKLKTVVFSDFIPEYQGRNVAEDVLKYLRRRLVSLHKDPSREIYCHFTCATDRESVNVILSALQDQILRNALDSALIM